MADELVGHLIVIGMNGEPCGERKNQYPVVIKEEATAILPIREIREHLEKMKSTPGSMDRSVIHFAHGGNDVDVPCAQVSSHQMTQIGRSKKGDVNFFVDDGASPPTVSRYACRIVIEKNTNTDSNYPRIFASAFDQSHRIFLGENAGKTVKRHDNQEDAFTANGVLILRPKSNKMFLDHDSAFWLNEWREVSILGRLFNLHGKRHRPSPDDECPDDNNLIDGTIIDLGGVALLWRSTQAVVPRDWMEQALLKPGRKWVCPMSLGTVILTDDQEMEKAYVYLGCGHVVSRRNKQGAPLPTDVCALKACSKPGKLVELLEPKEPFFFVDNGDEKFFCFVPCGHVVNEKTAKAWSNVPFLYEPSVSLCPFCGKHLEGKKYMELVVTVEGEC